MDLKKIILIFMIINICLSKKENNIKCNSNDDWIEYLSKNCRNNTFTKNNENHILKFCNGLHCYIEYKSNINNISTHLNEGCNNNFIIFNYHLKKACQNAKNQYKIPKLH